jgi:hypothetical protein
MAVEEILIAVKTYPSPSKKYDELVCTAGVRKDGSWVRIYPVPFRKLDFDKQYRKFQWISFDIERNYSDPRPETYKLKNINSIKLIGEIPTDKPGTWLERREYLLKPENVFSNKKKLIEDAYNPKKRTSLAVFKPVKFTGFKIEKSDREWDRKKIESINARALQEDLFLGAEKLFEVVGKVPYNFSYEFIDDEGNKSVLQIIDWEIGSLYWNCLKRHNKDEDAACEDVKKKYWDDFAHTKDTYLILGTTREFHLRKARNPFLIIGVFPPKHVLQTCMKF